MYDICTFALAVTDPCTYGESARKLEWEKAMLAAINAIQKNQMWELIKLLNGKEAIGLKWIFKTKFHYGGRVHRHKASFVVKG